MSVHFVLPDVQAKPGLSFEHLEWAGRYAAEKHPDVIICLGDFADMESLSSYDVGKKCFEGRTYLKDIEAAKEAMQAFLTPIKEEQKKLVDNHRERWNPRMVMLLGNHENRINRAINSDSKLDGLISTKDLGYADNWEVIPFLDVTVIDGVAYSHYFVTGVAGRPAGTAAAQLRKTNMSCIAGHQQGKQIAYGSKADGNTITSIIAGSFYQHDEDYLGPQGNKHWRGVLMLHEVINGSFDEMWVSLNYLKGKYGVR